MFYNSLFSFFSFLFFCSCLFYYNLSFKKSIEISNVGYDPISPSHHLDLPLGYYFHTVNICICIKDVNVTYTKKKKTRRKYIYKKLQFFVFEYRIYFTFETINFNVPVSLVLCNHENIKVLSQLLVIFILYIEYPSFFFGLHPYFLIVLSAITNLSTMTVYCVKYVNLCICVQKQQ